MTAAQALTRAAKHLRLVGYVRLTAAEQQGGETYQGQQDVLERWAVLYGHTLCAVVRDEGPGDTRPSERLGFRAALEMVRRGWADGMLTVRVDRLSTRLEHILEMAEDAHKRPWHIVAVDSPFDTTARSAEAVLRMLHCLHELAVAGRGEARATVRQMEMDLRVGAPAPEPPRTRLSQSRFAPMGWRFADGAVEARPRSLDGPDAPQTAHQTLHWHAGEQAILRRVVDLLEDDFGAVRIAARLNADGVHNPRTGQPWARGGMTSIIATLRREGLAKQPERPPVAATRAAAEARRRQRDARTAAGQAA